MDTGIDVCQHRWVSNRVLLPLLECCQPVTSDALTADQAVDLAGVLKALADPVRLRLLSLIASHAGGEACVCELTDDFDVSQPTISHHLKVLREAGLLTCERRASWVYYQVVSERIALLAKLFGAGAPVGTSS
ncbi:MAG: metalloregulator ArsR/SmtB family transcription factor [Actinomycetota bacterium]|nr:metalloregulator ArsR/SmtB family transcription factor [Actinomycetota bacterium]